MRDLVATCRGEWPKTSMCPLVGYSNPSSSLTVVDLPEPFGPEQAEHLAAPHLEIHVIHRARLGPAPEILEDLGQAANGNDHFAVTRECQWWSCSCNCS